MKEKRKIHRKSEREQLVIDEIWHIPKKKGNGQVRRQAWINKAGTVVRYSLAYINSRLCHADNGRVLGYDNAHGYHHKHYFGEITPIEFINFETIEIQFQLEFEVLHDSIKKKH
jgi:hypothetical protein